MQPYETSRDRNPYVDQGGHGHAPRGGASEGSATPIYDSLYAEYQRLFRALPGDRSDEEELRFEGFGSLCGVRQVPAGDGWGRSGRTYARQHYGGERGRALPAALPPAPRDGHRYGL